VKTVILKIVFSLVLFLIFGNLVFLDYVWLNERTQTVLENSPGKETFFTSLPSSLGCEQSCKSLIAQEVQEELARVTLPPSPSGDSSRLKLSPIPTQPLTPVMSPKIIYIPITSSGSTSAPDWTAIVPSEFYLDLTNYAGAKEIRLEAYLLAYQGAAQVSARLYDLSNNRAVDFSEVQTQNSIFTRVESSGMKIWRGNNRYVLQLKSGTGAQVQLQDAKIKILF